MLLAAEQLARRPRTLQILAEHWRIYLMEASLLGIFMISACSFAMLLEHPGSPVRQLISSNFFRRALMGLAMGATAVVLIYSRWGKRSGAQMNPAVTLSFLRLRRINPCDAFLYIFSQFVGGAMGVAVVSVVARPALMHPAVNFVSTRPGVYGPAAAWMAEFLIAFVLLTMVLNVNKRPALAPYTGLFAGALVALYITFEAPISGMSLNPARTFASAFNSRMFKDLWIYFTAPICGMLASVEVNRVLSHVPENLCGKFSHSRTVSCIFKCNCIDKRGPNERL